LSFRAQGIDARCYHDPELFEAYPELHNIKSAAEAMYKERRRKENAHRVSDEQNKES